MRNGNGLKKIVCRHIHYIFSIVILHIIFLNGPVDLFDTTPLLYSITSGAINVINACTTAIIEQDIATN
jgi:hypothetical protein